MSADARWMREALRMAERAFESDEVPVGAMIVCREKVVAKAHNQVETLKDPTAHAEMIALTQAANALGCKWLKDCALYVTIEPCFMCAGALVLSRIGRVCFGAFDPKAGACGSLANVARDPRLNHSIEVVPGILEEECSRMMSEFFRRKRKARIALEN